MFEEMNAFGLREPVFTSGESSIRVTLTLDTEEVVEGTGEEQLSRLAGLRKLLGDEKLTLLLSTIKLRQHIPTRDVAVLLDCSPRTARTYMKLLEAQMLVTKTQISKTDPATVWSIVASPIWKKVAIS